MELGNRYVNLDEGKAKLHLRRAGLSRDKFDDQLRLNELEQQLVQAQIDRYVDYAGPIAGHGCGRLTGSDGSQYLVTTAARVLVSKNGKWEHLRQFLEELCLNIEQFSVVCAWLKCARESQLKIDFRPGQLLVLAGPPACGKSLLQTLVSEYLGGRVAKPYRYFVGETPFNADLAAAEHLMIEDENASTDIRSRRAFGGKIKEFAVNRDMSVHPKGRQAFTVATFRRLTLSVNEEPENLMILPPMDESLIDKITLILCGRATVGSDRKKVWNTLAGELPAFAHWLEEWPIPAKLRDARFGVRAYQHPVLMDALSDLSPEFRLLEIIDAVFFKTGNDPVCKLGEAVKAELLRSEFQFTIQRLLDFPGAVGTYLGRLVKTGRVTKTPGKSGNLWTITSP
jgi:hypothetical protein